MGNLDQYFRENDASDIKRSWRPRKLDKWVVKKRKRERGTTEGKKRL